MKRRASIAGAVIAAAAATVIVAITHRAEPTKEPRRIVYRARDGGFIEHIGQLQVRTAHSPCRARPVGAPKASCLAKGIDGGERDQGAENVMQPGDWIDHGGCVETACTVMQGEKP